MGTSSKMRILERKVTIAVLWLLQVANYVAYILISLFETEPFGAAIEGGSGPTLAVFFFVPCLMAWLTLVSLRISRWPNVVLGSLFASLKLAAALGLVAEVSAAAVFNELWAFLAAALVVFYAWKKPSDADVNTRVGP